MQYLTADRLFQVTDLAHLLFILCNVDALAQLDRTVHCRTAEFPLQYLQEGVLGRGWRARLAHPVPVPALLAGETPTLPRLKRGPMQYSVLVLLVLVELLLN